MSTVVGTVNNLPSNTALEFRNKANANDKVTTPQISAPGGAFSVALGDGKTYSIYMVSSGDHCWSPSRITVDGPMVICVKAVQ